MFDFKIFSKLYLKYQTETKKEIEPEKDPQITEPNPDQKDSIKKPEKPKISWRKWKEFKRNIYPVQKFNYKLINELMSKFPKEIVHNFRIQDEVIVYCEDCYHVHSGQILTNN